MAGLLAAGLASAAPAPRVATGMMAKPMTRASSVRVSGDGACKVYVSLQISRPQTYAYNMATGDLGLDPVPAENTNPIPGIGVVIKKNPGGSAERLLRGPDGGAALNPPDGDGVYDLVIHLPPPARAAPGCAGAAGAKLVFTLQKTGASFTVLKAENAINTKGTGTTRVRRPN